MNNQPFNYEDYTLSDLADCVERIDRQAYPENALALDRELLRRLLRTVNTSTPIKVAPNSSSLPPSTKWQSFAVAAFLAALVTLLATYGFVRFHTYFAKRYVHTRVSEFIHTWDPDVFLSLVPPPNRQNERVRTNTPILAERFAKVGIPSSLNPPVGHVNLSFSSGILPVLTATFTVEGQFPTGPASVEMTLQRYEGEWYLDLISVISDYFVSNPV